MQSGLHPLLREKVIPAEINFRSKEELGDWHSWRALTADATPPWWDAGADYVWEALLAFVDGFTQHTWAVDFPAVVNDELIALAEDVFEKKLKPYESDFTSSRRDEFVSFVQKRLAGPLARLSRERWEKTTTGAQLQDDARVPLSTSKRSSRRKVRSKPHPDPEGLNESPIVQEGADRPGSAQTYPPPANVNDVSPTQPVPDKTILGRKVDELRRECGWSFEELAVKTGIEKKLILGHVNKGKGAYPRTIKTYADAFSKALNREVTVAELEADRPPKT